MTFKRSVVAERSVLGSAGTAPAPPPGAAVDAVCALLNLGLRPAQAATAVAAAKEELGGTSALDALVRLTLGKAAK